MEYFVTLEDTYQIIIDDKFGITNNKMNNECEQLVIYKNNLSMWNSARTKIYIILDSKLYNKVVLNSICKNKRWNIRSGINRKV